MTEQLPLDGFSDEADSVEAILKWIGRSYPTMEEWKNKGREVFFSVNGDSDVARNRLASFVRGYFVESSLEPETVSRWTKGSTAVEEVVVAPPKVSTANSPYIDWAHVADYLLLACATLSDELIAENTKRDAEYRQVQDSYRIRLMVHDARDVLRANQKISDSDLMKQLSKKHEKIGLVHIKEAKKLEKEDARFAPPRAPIQAAPIPRYKPIYFGDAKDTGITQSDIETT